MSKVWTTVIIVVVVAIIAFISGSAYSKKQYEKNLLNGEAEEEPSDEE